MGPGGLIEPFDPQMHASAPRVSRRDVNATKRVLSAAADVEQASKSAAETDGRRKSYLPKTPHGWCILAVLLLTGLLCVFKESVLEAPTAMHPIALISEAAGEDVGKRYIPGASHVQEDEVSVADSQVVQDPEHNADGEEAVAGDRPSGESVTASLDEGENDEGENDEGENSAGGQGDAQHTEEDLEVLTTRVQMLDDAVRKMKRSLVVMETDPEAVELTASLQEATRSLLRLKYGPGPYQLAFNLEFPTAMGGPSTESLTIEMAPIELMPHAVHQFMKIVEGWKGGAFHRNAGHVLQARVEGNFDGLAWQEYHPEFPHVRYTLGYAGRPGGPPFYISTVDNSANHGPGSQGSKTEADSCFAKLVSGVSVVRRMQTQPGIGNMGFVEDSSNHIRISSITRVQQNR